MPEQWPRIFVDYNLVGRSTTFSTRVRRAQRLTLAVGDAVIVEGDGVPAYVANVVAIDGTSVRLELWKDQHGQPYQPQPCDECGHDDAFHFIFHGKTLCSWGDDTPEACGCLIYLPRPKPGP